MTWDHTMVERAKAEGWQLTTIIDNGQKHPYFMVTRLDVSHLPDDRQAGEYVVQMARRGNALHRHALHTIMQSRIKPTKEKR